MKSDFGLLILRCGFGLSMLFGHGLDKLIHFSDRMGKFPDPLGIGSTASLAMATFAEFFCSVCLIIGFFTRIAAVPLFVTMSVAAFIVHASDPWNNKELAVLYGIVYLTLTLTGGGKFSFDALFRK